MLPKRIEETLLRLEDLVRAGQFAELETDEFELKSVPATGGAWDKVYESINAFLNTRSGAVILGVRETGQGEARKYEFTGWRSEVEAKLKPEQLRTQFIDSDGHTLDLTESIHPLVIRPFLHGQIAILPIGELSDREKYVFFRGCAYRRLGTGDHAINDHQLAVQLEVRRKSRQARELDVVPGTSVSDLDLQAFNDYLTQLNQGFFVENLKNSLEQARPSLERRSFLKDGQATVLGLLVCGDQSTGRLGLRAQVHCYVNVDQELARDRQILKGTVPRLMEETLRYVRRNIHIGLSPQGGGTQSPQYPEELLREMINNALAHRDYELTKQVFVSIRPGRDLQIRNPGLIPKALRIESPPGEPVAIRRLIPSAQTPNPELANVLSHWNRWEGRSTGMSSLVNLCLKNEIDLPTYQLRLDEVELRLPTGKLLDARLELWLASFDRYIAGHLGGGRLEEAQRRVLAYLIKSQWANDQGLFTVLLTSDNNHTRELTVLRDAGLVHEHVCTNPLYPVYVVAPELVCTNYRSQLAQLLQERFGRLPGALHQRVLEIVYRRQQYSFERGTSAKQASFELWPEQRGEPDDIRGFDRFYRKVRSVFSWLTKVGILLRDAEGSGNRCVLNPSPAEGQQLLPFE